MIESVFKWMDVAASWADFYHSQMNKARGLISIGAQVNILYGLDRLDFNVSKQAMLKVEAIQAQLKVEAIQAQLKVEAI